MSSYYNLICSIFGPNETLQRLSETILSDSKHTLFASNGAEFMTEGQLYFCESFRHDRKWREAFKDLVRDYPELSVRVKALSSADWGIRPWTETYTNEGGFHEEPIQRSFINELHVECEDDGLLLYNIDLCAAAIRRFATDVSVDGTVIRFNTEDQLMELPVDFLKMVVDAKITFRFKLVEESVEEDEWRDDWRFDSVFRKEECV